MGEWMPIESAPRNGTKVLTYNVTPTEDEETGETEMVCAISVAYFWLGQWVEYPASARFIRGQKHTHWMPLPEPPKE